MLLNIADYRYVESTHCLASHVGGKVGSLKLNVVVHGLGAFYQVVHNNKVVKEVDGSQDAAIFYNKILTDNGVQ